MKVDNSYKKMKITTSSFLILPLATFFPDPPQSPCAILPTSINSLSELTLFPIPLVTPLAPFPAGVISSMWVRIKIVIAGPNDPIQTSPHISDLNSKINSPGQATNKIL